MIQNIRSTVTLNNGVEMPLLGFGTFKVEDGQSVIDSVKEALRIGYRHIDTAAIYGNEEGVGIGIKESGVPREEIFLVSKVWNGDQGYEKTLEAFEISCQKLGTDYLDLYLIHWPQSLNADTWRAMEKLYREGRIKAIGVSNFMIKHLEELFKTAEIMPTINQVEYHPQLAQTELHDFCKKHNIVLEAWGPLMQGQIFQVPLFKELADKYGKTISQIALRWDLQMGVVTIPKSITPSRIAENCDLYDFEITEEDMAKIAELNTETRIGMHPDDVFA